MPISHRFVALFHGHGAHLPVEARAPTQVLPRIAEPRTDLSWGVLDR